MAVLNFSLSLLAAFLLAFCSISFVAQADTDEICPGNYRHGQRVDRGRYWYECQHGQLVPKGCFSSTYQRMNVYESYKSHGYSISCVFDENGYLGFAYKACVYNNYEYMPGQSWQDNKFWYTCVREGETLRMEMSGCVYENQRYVIGDSIERGDFFYECRRQSNGSCSMCPAGCLNQNQRYRIGDSFEQGKYWYACTMEEGRMMKKCVGCMWNQRRMQDGDRYVQNDAVIECTIRQGNNPDHKLVGCMDVENGQIIERKLGCQWIKGVKPYQYVMKCVKQNEHAVIKKAVQCYYGIRDGGYEINPGCFKIDDNKLIMACFKTDNVPRIETYPIEQLKDTYLKGLKFC